MEKNNTQRETHKRKWRGKEERYRVKEELMAREDIVGIQNISLILNFAYIKSLDIRLIGYLFALNQVACIKVKKPRKET